MCSFSPWSYLCWALTLLPDQPSGRVLCLARSIFAASLHAQIVWLGTPVRGELVSFSSDTQISLSSLEPSSSLLFLLFYLTSSSSRSDCPGIPQHSLTRHFVHWLSPSRFLYSLPISKAALIGNISNKGCGNSKEQKNNETIRAIFIFKLAASNIHNHHVLGRVSQQPKGWRSQACRYLWFGWIMGPSIRRIRGKALYILRQNLYLQ